MNADWITQQLDFVHFSSGCFLASLFLMCSFLHISERERPGKPPWHLLGLFGLSSCLHEWLELVSFVRFDGQLFSGLGLLTMVLAYLFLLEFGRRGTPRFAGARVAWALYGSALLLVLAGLPYGLSGVESTARYFLALPAGLIAAWLFFREFTRRPADERSPFLPLSIAFALFAVSTGSSSRNPVSPRHA